MAEIKRIIKLGGSMAVLLKPSLARLFNWDIGDTVKVEYDSEKIVISRPVGIQLVSNPSLLKINKEDLK